MANKSFRNVSWLLGEPITNFCMSIVDDAVKANADLHYEAGMSPKIVRKTDGKCCEWCSKQAGEYKYPNVPRDVYRRHQNCGCTVEYSPGDGKKQNVHTKTWGKEGVMESVQLRLASPNGIKRTKAIPYSERGIEIPEKAKEILKHTLSEGEYIKLNEKIDDRLLEILATETGVEYARIVFGDTTIILRGSDSGILIPNEVVDMMKKNKGSLDAHCHPFIGDLIPSVEDIDTLTILEDIVGQNESKIIVPGGNIAIYNKHGIIEIDNISNSLSDAEKDVLRKLFGG